MNGSLINGNVFSDYRDNILIDCNNPILAFKANRDRYTGAANQKAYAGHPHIASINSEDALTWNVFRTLQAKSKLDVLNSLLGEVLIKPKILIWTLAFDDQASSLQYDVGSLIRSIDGKHKGQITEPDLIICTENKIYVGECKLGTYNQYPAHLWDNKSSGSKTRYKDYFTDNDNPFIKSISNTDPFYHKVAYQLFRMAFYAHLLGKRLKKNPVLLSITNESWWNLETERQAPSKIWDQFCLKYIKSNELESRNIFWQDIHGCVQKDSSLQNLSDYLGKHRCLYKEVDIC
jgi:hypothetical protein